MANKNKLMEKAQKLLQKGKIEDTIATLNEVIDVDPTDFRVLLKKGELEARIGDESAAKQSYTQVAEQYSRDGFYLKAVAIYKKILKLDPEAFEIYVTLAQLYRKLGLDSEAKKNLRLVADHYKAKGLKTNYHEVAAQLAELGENVTDAKIHDVEVGGGLAGQNRAVEELRKLAQSYVESGNGKQLDAVIQKMDQLEIKDLPLYISLARGYINGKAPKKALQVIQRGYVLEPTNTTILELLARCFLELKQPQKTASVFNELAKMYERHGDLRNLKRVKTDMLKLNDPNVILQDPIFDSVKEFDEERSIEVSLEDQSEEFVIEDVQSFSRENSYRETAPVKKHTIEDVNQYADEGSFSDLEKELETDFSNDFENNKSSTDQDQASYMDVFVDPFDGNEATVFGSPKESAKKEPPKKQPVQEIELSEEDSLAEGLDDSEFERSELSEEPFSFQRTTGFTADIKESMEENLNLESENKDEPDIELMEVNFERSVPQEPIAKQKPKEPLIGFNEFYSENPNEKSEISVNEEEFVSIAQFINEPGKPRQHAPSEKIEIHDRVVKPSAKFESEKTSFKHESLAQEVLKASVEPLSDFSDFDLGDPAARSVISETQRSYVPQKESDSLLEDPELDENSFVLDEQVQLDEKTIMDIKHEFEESSKIDRPKNDEAMFDLSAELKDEISEFEKSFGTMDEDAEEEFLSPEEVILEFKKGVARTVDKSDFQTHYNLGVAYKEMGLIDEAISSFELASSNPETKIDAISMIGICLAIKNDFQSAVKLYQKVLPSMNYQDPKYLGLTFQMGEAFMELGQHMDAYRAFSKVKDIEPTFRDVKSRVKELSFNLGIQNQDPTQQSGKIIVDMQARKKNKI